MMKDNNCIIWELLKSFLKDEIANKEIICKNKSDSDKEPSDSWFKCHIYNEYSLQYELAVYLRNGLNASSKISEYEIFFEKNISTCIEKSEEKFGKENEKHKHEVDLIVIRKNEEKTPIEKYAIELKFPINGQYPEQMKKFIEDMKFMKKIKDIWDDEQIKNNTFCLTMVNDKNFYELTGKENNKSNNYDVYQKFRMKDGKIYKQIDENGINLKIFWNTLKEFENSDTDDIKCFLIDIGKNESCEI